MNTIPTRLASLYQVKASFQTERLMSSSKLLIIVYEIEKIYLHNVNEAYTKILYFSEIQTN